MRCFSILLLALLPSQLLSGSDNIPLSDAEVQALAQNIDQLVYSKLKQEKLDPNSSIDDATFLRRSYLRVAGRIPNLDEAKSFLDSKHIRKRSELIDTLLASKGHVHDMYIYWADLFRTKANLAGFQVQPAGIPFIDWIKEQIELNTPYDKFVHQMLSATGEFWEKGNGALGYYAIDRSTPLDNMSNSVQVFLGTQLQCAQCHNHPFDKWTQKQFFEMAAFTDAQSWSGDYAKTTSSLRKESRKDGHSVAFTRIERMFSAIIGYGFHETGDGRIRLPKDYSYHDAKPLEYVYANTIFGDKVHLEALTKGKKSNDSRIEFATWVTSKSNPRFTTVIANRMWKKIMGLGLIEPVDNFKDGTQATNPALMTFLENMMQDLHYDLREFKRVILNTNTYQSEAVQRDHDDFSPFHFQGPLFERMTGEQIWDSISTLVDNNVDQTEIKKTPPLYELNKIYRTWDSDKLIKEMEKYEKMLVDFGYDITSRTINDPILIALLLADNFPEREESKRVMKLLNEWKNKGGYRRSFVQRDVNENVPEVRASEINTGNGGAPLGHFIMEFGGSTRQIIQTQRQEAEITQPLFMMNDFMESQVIRKTNSALYRNIQGSETIDGKVNTAFLSILNRYPKQHERETMNQYLKTTAAKTSKQKNSTNPIFDITWALVNSHEFLFIP